MNSSIKGSGSVQSQLKVLDMECINIVIPPTLLIQEFSKQVEIIGNSISQYEKIKLKIKRITVFAFGEDWTIK